MIAVYKPTGDITVRCWGYDVGALALDPRTGYYAFEYYPAFQKSDIELAPLTMPLSQSGPRVFPNLPTSTYHRLPAFIADSIPDDFGNNLINAWMAQQGISRSQITPLDRLAYMGKRGMGALEFYPTAIDQAYAPSALEMSTLVTTARKSLVLDLTGNEAKGFELELAQLISVGTSAGGARAKAVVGFNEHTKEFMSGQFSVPADFSHWIIKFDVPSPQEAGNSHEYGRIEYAYHLMAQQCGIDVTDAQLFEVAGRAHFMTKRFDRDDDGSRHHVQTLCALAELDFNVRGVHDYGQLFLAATELGLPFETNDEIFRRLVFNVAASNKDDHTKNHSFILKQGHFWELAPAYDVTHAYGTWPGAWTAQHSMGVNGKFNDIERQDLVDLGRRFSVRAPERVIDGIVDTLSSWPDFARMAGLSDSEQDRVGKDISHCCHLLRY